MSRKPVRKLSDGTHATQRAFYTLDSAHRIAVASVFVGTSVEIELRFPYANKVIWGELVDVAQMMHGTTRDVLIVKLRGDVISTAISGASVRSISELTNAEIEERVHAS